MLGSGSYDSQCYGFNALPMPTTESQEKKLELFVHTKKALQQREVIRKRFCTGRERTDSLCWEQRYPPTYDPARHRIAEVRHLSKDEVIVYMHPVEEITTRLPPETRWE